MEMSGRKGTVKFFNEPKGFGFIKDMETEKEYFVHFSKIVKGPIKENDNVKYDLVDSESKPGQLDAINVELE